MEAFYSWIRNIVCCLCLFHIFLQVLPGESFKKYVRFFGGLILLLMTAAPLSDAAHVAAGFERAWNLESLREQAEDIRLTGEGMEELRSERINEAYQREVKRQMEEVVRAYGLHPQKTELVFSEEEGQTLNILEARLQVTAETELLNNEISDIKKEFQEVYHIPAGHINISIQE